MAVRKQSKREPELGVASTQSFPRGRFLANRCRSCARILSLGQPGSVLSTRQMQLMATVYTRRAPQDINLPERKILVEHRAKQPSVIILLRRMYHLLINALCGADQHPIPQSANQASHEQQSFFPSKEPYGRRICKWLYQNSWPEYTAAGLCVSVG